MTACVCLPGSSGGTGVALATRSVAGGFCTGVLILPRQIMDACICMKYDGIPASQCHTAEVNLSAAAASLPSHIHCANASIAAWRWKGTFAYKLSL